jgi:hypothetical protein
MNSELLNRGRLEYIQLNKRFLQLVEAGTSWEELQPIMEEMKSLAIYLQRIPSNTDEVNIISKTNTQESAEVQEEPV